MKRFIFLEYNLLHPKIVHLHNLTPTESIGQWKHTRKNKNKTIWVYLIIFRYLNRQWSCVITNIIICTQST